MGRLLRRLGKGSMRSKGLGWFRAIIEVLVGHCRVLCYLKCTSVV